MNRAVLLASLLAVPQPTEAQPPAAPVFGARVEAVYVDAFATHAGQPVTGLRADDFELRDNGVTQQIELVSIESLPVLAVLAFDTSGSVAAEKRAALIAAGEAFLDGLRPQDEASLLVFSHRIESWTPPTRDRRVIGGALRGLAAGGNTAVYDALYAALTLPDSRARTLVVLFSDGEDNAGWLDEEQLRLQAERANALVHVVGIHDPRTLAVASAISRPFWSRGVMPSTTSRPLFAGVEPDGVRVLRETAELTGGRYWVAESPARLTSAFAAISEAMGQRYVLRYVPQDVARLGWHRLDVRLHSHKGEVHARRGYWVGVRQTVERGSTPGAPVSRP